MILSDNTTIIIFIFIIIFVFIFIVIVNSSEYSGSRAGSLFGQWEKPEKVLLLDPVPIAPCLPLCIILHKVLHCVFHCVLYCTKSSTVFCTVCTDTYSPDCIEQCIYSVIRAQWTECCSDLERAILFVLHSTVHTVENGLYCTAQWRVQKRLLHSIQSKPIQVNAQHCTEDALLQCNFLYWCFYCFFCVKINFAPLRWTALLMLHLIKIGLLHCSTFSCIAYCCKAFYWMALIISILMLMLVLPYFFPA